MEMTGPEKTIEDSISNKQLVVEGGWWLFSESEKAEIALCLPRKKIIKKWTAYWPKNNEGFDNIYDQVEKNFILEVEYYCNAFLFWREGSQGITRHGDDLQDMEKAFKKAMKQLRKIYEFKVSIPVSRGISFPDPQRVLADIVRKHTVEKAFIAYNILENLCLAIEKYQEPKIGRGGPGIKKDSTELAIKLAKEYYENFLIMPTTTKEGDFSNLFSVIMKFVSRDKSKNEDPDHSRALRAAIKALKKSL